MCAKRIGPFPKPGGFCGGSDWPDPRGLNDDELLDLIESVTRRFLSYLEPLDADILARADLRGHPIARIIHDTGLEQAEIAGRLRSARQSLCQFIRHTLKPVESRQLPA